jgi:3-hydroxybutyryl-CoA dehydratase
VGDTIYVNTKVLQIEPGARGRRGVVTWQKQLVKQTGRVVQEGIVVSMVEGRASKRRNSSEAAQSAPAS